MYVLTKDPHVPIIKPNKKGWGEKRYNIPNNINK